MNASYIADGDDVMYGYGFGYFSAIPEGAVALVQADGSKTPTEGFIPAISERAKAAYEAFLDGGVLGFSYDTDTVHAALFANTLTQKVHQRDEYAYISPIWTPPSTPTPSPAEPLWTPRSGRRRIAPRSSRTSF